MEAIPLNAAGGEGGSDRYRGKRKRGIGRCCLLRRETQQEVQFRANWIPQNDPCRSTLSLLETFVPGLEKETDKSNYKNTKVKQDCDTLHVTSFTDWITTQSIDSIWGNELHFIFVLLLVGKEI